MRETELEIVIRNGDSGFYVVARTFDKESRISEHFDKLEEAKEAARKAYQTILSNSSMCPLSVTEYKADGSQVTSPVSSLRRNN